MRSNLILSDAIDYMRSKPDDCYGAIITSPPYNIGVNYGSFKDSLSFDDYKEFSKSWIKEALRLSPIVMINFGARTSEPVMLCHFGVWCSEVGVLQQTIVWVKSISVKDKSYGHYKPVNSARYLNNLYENIYVVTRDGSYPLDKLSVGVPYQDKSNLTRRGIKQDKRDRGNIIFLPYKTRNAKEKHPATFPKELAAYMISLTGTKRMIFDPFAGTGATLDAAYELNLEAEGTDIKDWSDSV